MVYSWELEKFPTRCFLGTDSTPSTAFRGGSSGPLLRGWEARELESGAYDKKGPFGENGIIQMLGFGKSVKRRTVIQYNLPVQRRGRGTTSPTSRLHRFD